jgi:hypothetical protein
LGERLTLGKARELLKAIFETVDYESTKEDAVSFVRDREGLNAWEEELFLATLNELKE